VSYTMDASVGNTTVSPAQQGTAATSSPGASGPGAQTPVATQVLLAAGFAIVGAVGIAYVFRKGEKEVPLHFDSATAMWVFLAYQAINMPLTAIAYKFHGHKAAQAWLMFH
jgi:TPP-dependent pyruvate/acetoin dehydrogenase alpha subunit